MWTVLSKYGIPPTMLNIIKSFHQGMHATVRIGSTTSESIVHNSLRQGCTLAPSLFKLYFCAMVTNWRDSCPQAGVDMLYKHGRKLVSDRTAKSKLHCTKITESQFADDATLYTTTRRTFEHSTKMLADTAQEWVLTVNVSKTKGLTLWDITQVEKQTLLR